MERFKILICNDDGLFAPGLRTLWEALMEADIADIVLIAPAVEQSGTGTSITWNRPILIEEIQWDKNTPAWAIDGTPADCIKLGINLLLKSPPDLIVSGINAGSNAGRNVLHSGTIGAVIEGVLRGIPGIAFSCEDGQHPNFHVAKKYIKQVVEYVREYPLPSGTFLNVNFPHAAQDVVKGFALTRQGKGRWIEKPALHIETKRGPTYFLGGKPEEIMEIEDSDIALMKQGYMTAVPIHVHELTEMKVLEEHKKTFEKYFRS
jgi:5'-nucleotidase